MRRAALGIGRRWARTGGARLFGLMVVGGLALLAGSANAAPVAAVPMAGAPMAGVAAALQAGTQVVERFHFSVATPGRLCVGQNYPMPVTMLVDFQMMANGQPVEYQDRVVPGITIQASSDDNAVAGITPAQLTSGILQVDLLASPPFGTANGQGQVVFSLHAKKEGVANLHFQAHAPAALAGGGPQPAPIEIPVKVENCKYKVTVTGSWKVNYKGQNLATILKETLHGEMTRDEAGVLSGTANVSWDLRSFSAMCSHAHMVTPSTASLKGEQTGATLHFHLTYDAFEEKTVNCGSANHGKIQVSPIEFIDFPASGASASTSLPFPVGNEVLNGAGTVSIVPVPLK